MKIKDLKNDSEVKCQIVMFDCLTLGNSCDTCPLAVVPNNLTPERKEFVTKCKVLAECMRLRCMAENFDNLDPDQDINIGAMLQLAQEGLKGIVK